MLHAGQGAVPEARLSEPSYVSVPRKPVTLAKRKRFSHRSSAVAVTKTEVVSARVPPDVKAALSAAAELERRSVASMLEVMVLSYCREHGIATAAINVAGKSRTRSPRK
jgi:hypothetical protein